MILDQVLLEIGERLDIVRHLFPVGIDHENDAIDALEHQLPRRVVDRLAGNGVELETGGEAGQRLGVERKKVEEERAVGIGGQRDQFALLGVGDLLVQRDQIGGLAAQGRALINNL